MFRDEHMNLYTIFQRAQLLERFGALQRRRFPFHKLQERLAPKTVNALDVANSELESGLLSKGIAPGRSKERIRPDRQRLCFDAAKPLRSASENGCAAVTMSILRSRPQLLHKLVDQIGIKQRLVSLDINHERVLLRFAHDLRDPVGAALMMQRGQGDLGSPAESRIRDSHVIRSDDHGIQFFRSPATLPNVSEKRFACNEMQWFSRKAGRSPTRRNNSDHLSHL